MGDMDQASYVGPRNIWRHRKKFRRPGARGLFASGLEDLNLPEGVTTCPLLSPGQEDTSTLHRPTFFSNFVT